VPIPQVTGAADWSSIRLSALQFGVGGFCAAVGALMLVVPYQFATPAYAALQSQLAWSGPALVLAGAGLFAAATLAPRFRIVFLAHLWTAAILLMLAVGFASSGSWSGSTNYLVLGLGIGLAPLFAGSRPQPKWLRGQFFSLLMGFGAVLTGLLMLGWPDQFSASAYNQIRPHLAWYGMAFIASGLLVCLSRVGQRITPGLGRWVPVLVACVFFAYGAAVAIPNHVWTGVAYYWGFGGYLILLSSMGPRLVRVDPGSLRTRLALILAAAAAIPLLVLVPLYANEEENQALSEVLARQQVVSVALAQDVADYIGLHQAVVKLLAGQPGLLALSPSEQHNILQNSKAAYPDVAGFGTVDAGGDTIARADDRLGTSWIGDPLFEEVRRTHASSMAFRDSPVTQHPIFSLGAPILDSDGRFLGMVSASLESARIADFLIRTDLGVDAKTYLVDTAGRVIAHPDQRLVASFADLSSTPAVNTFLNDPLPNGSLRITRQGQAVLASYARVPDLGLGVIVERPATSALAPTHGKLDLLFAGLLLAIGGAAGFGALAAGWLSRPLATLLAAVDGLATGDDTPPLLSGGLTEVAGLAKAFGEMRTRVISHATELRDANTELEALYRVGQTITAPLQLDVVLNTIARCTADVLRTDAAAILLVDHTTQTLSVEGAYGLSQHAITRTRDRVGESIAGRVAHDGQPLVANDLPNNPLFVNPAAVQEHLLAVASVPLIVGEKIIGTLDVHSKTDRFAFGDHHVHVLQMIAGQAAIAIDNAHLYQELRASRDELEVRVEARTAELTAAYKQLQAEIVERTEAEAAQLRTEAQARRLIESNVIGTVVVQLDGQVIEANDAFLQLLGYTREEVQSGQVGLDALTPSEYRAMDERAIERTRLDGVCPPREKEYIARDGRRVPVLLGMALLEQEPNTYVAFIVDLTERKQAEAQIHALNSELERRVVERTAELEAANKELEAFSYSVSHDLRAPLRAINGFSRILLEEHAAQLLPEAVGYLEVVSDNARQMGSLIDDLLSFSRLSRQGLRKDRVLPAELVREVFDDLAFAREGRTVNLVIGELLTCHADAALLKQVFANLLGNALKFTRLQAVGNIEVGCSHVDGEVVYFVRDDGAGFDMKYAQKLFGVFQRLHHVEDYEGTGVGLAIVQRIVNRHGGRVWADGAPGQGASFSFTLGADETDTDWSVDAQFASPPLRAGRTPDDSPRSTTRHAA
jgi:PAS domain S-box-containing protein